MSLGSSTTQSCSPAMDGKIPTSRLAIMIDSLSFSSCPTRAFNIFSALRIRALSFSISERSSSFSAFRRASGEVELEGAVFCRDGGFEDGMRFHDSSSEVNSSRITTKCDFLCH